MQRPFRVLLLSLACSAALTTYAQTAEAAPINIPPGDLVSALDALARQSGAQFVYRTEQLSGLRTPGVQGAQSAQEALGKLLQGSQFEAQRDASGAMVIVKRTAPAKPRVAKQVSMAQQAPTTPEAPAPAVQELETIQVTGSRIPRAQLEGPAPITSINAEEIKAAGFTNVADVLRSMNQNGGETQSQQSPTGAVTTPGAQQVDLRGLGPNHTLVLINGRRTADFPLPLRGRSNFTDIGNIPLGMIERIEILTGSASAVYGSDAMAGVVNFILKKSADGTTIDYRYGDTSRGGGESQRLSLTTGFSNDNFNAIFGIEFQHKKPLWAFDRKIQDSTLDNPDPSRRGPRTVASRYDDDNYGFIDPENCDGLSSLNGGSTVYAEDADYGFYCGSDKSIAYGTIENERKGVNAYASLSYRFNDTTEWFADAQLGYNKVALMADTLDWEFQDPNSYRDYAHVFNNATNGGTIENWFRQFSPEESGGFDRQMTRTTQKTFGLATGLKGSFGAGWDYEAAFNHSQYHAKVSFPRVVADAANELFLGESQGYDDYGYAIYDADPARLFTALTRAEYDSITANSVFNPEARSDTVSFTMNKTDLFSLPAGAVGFAGVLEYGTQSYHINPDPLALTTYYYGARYGDGDGDRSHWSAAGEMRAPLLETLTASVAGRYDQYSYGDKEPGKFTYSLGLEWRPVDTLLVRGSYGTGFRAPDLHYLFAGADYFRTRSTDYYGCRVEDPDAEIADCRSSLRRARVTDVREGDKELDYETSKSFTAGFVWSPSANFDVSVDYFNIEIANQIQDMSRDKILQDEANCRLGETIDGTAVDPTSPTCINAVSRVRRDADGNLLGVNFGPINISEQSTAGIDLAAHYKLSTRIGDFRFGLGHTYFREHESKQFAGDTSVDHFEVNSGYDIPRTKSNATVSWEKDSWSATLHGQRIGRLPTSDSYDGIFDSESGDSPWIGATYRYNASVQYKFNDHAQLSLAVNNLMDKMPPKDATYTSYPYYDLSWFDSVGRSYYLQFTYKFGGIAL